MWKMWKVTPKQTKPKEHPTPPDYFLWNSPDGEFQKLSQKWHETFRMHCKLEPEYRILEIGCGAGRMALPFEGFLTTGSYDGVDIREDYIGWANHNIGSQKLRFQHLNLTNPHYRKKGGEDAARAKLPFADAAFDFIFLTSVFTHLNAREMENYVRESWRLLKPNRYLLSTYFLLNKHSRANIAGGVSQYRFKHKTEEFTWDEARWDRGRATALEEDRVLQTHHAYGFQTSVILGAWSSSKAGSKPVPSPNPNPRHNQDIVVAFKS
jgi:SAM-dependent methyltransferase